MVVGDNHNYLIALVVPDFDQVSQTLAIEDAPEEMINNDQVKSLILNDLEQLSAPLASFETIKNVGLIPNEFSIEGRELTPTLKLRRNEIIKKYDLLITSHCMILMVKDVIQNERKNCIN